MTGNGGVHRGVGVPMPAVFLERSLETGKKRELGPGDPFVAKRHRKRKTRNKK